jgi:hypothetical protein
MGVSVKPNVAFGRASRVPQNRLRRGHLAAMSFTVQCNRLLTGNPIDDDSYPHRLGKLAA